jgi:electron transport complex protein RnfB
MSPLSERINAALPQTQCTRCGYPDCASYAQAIDAGEAGINQCPPGGAEGISRLAAITGQAVSALNPDNGSEGPRLLAVIDEAWCIGCTLCLDVCPTDAILGSNKLMHTVIEAACTGCELCIPVCPVDCISLENASGSKTGWDAWSEPDADMAKQRYDFHRQRLNKLAPLAGNSAKNATGSSLEQASAASAVLPARSATDSAVIDKKRAVIDAALARARAQRPTNN